MLSKIDCDVRRLRRGVTLDMVRDRVDDFGVRKGEDSGFWSVMTTQVRPIKASASLTRVFYLHGRHHVGPGFMRGVRLVAFAFGVALLAGCGGGSGGPTPINTGTPTAIVGTPIAVAEKEYSITLSNSTLNSGTYTFVINNQGTMPHNLVVKGPGVDSASSPTLDPGGTGQLTVTLQAGTYELWCSVDAHRDQGMDLSMKVS